MTAFSTPLVCPAVAHHFVASNATLLGQQATYADTVPGSTWTLSSVNASSGAPISPFEGAALLTSATAQASRTDPFNPVQRAWILHNSNGLALSTGAGPPFFLGTSGRGFSVAVWFRVDDFGPSNPTDSAVLQLQLTGLPSDPTSQLTLTLAANYNHTFTIALDARIASTGGGANTEADYAISSSTEEFGTVVANQPNGGAFAVGVWQHAVLSFDATGTQSLNFFAFPKRETCLGRVLASGGAPTHETVCSPRV